MEKEFRNKILNATKWSAISELSAKLITPVVNMILARLLIPSEFGIVASISIVTSFADIFTDAGFQKYIVQHEFDDDQTLNRYSDVSFTSNSIMSLIIYCVIFLLRRSFASAVGCPEAYNGLAVAALTVLCTSFSSIAIARFRRNLDYKPLFYIRICSSFIPLFITVPVAFTLRTYWAIVIGSVVQQLFIAILAICLSDYKPVFRVDIKVFFDMVSFCTWNLMETLSIWFTGQANIFIVASVLTSHYLGLYKTGMSTINSYMALVTAVLTSVLFSSLSRLQRNRTAYLNLFYKTQKVLAMLVIPMGVGIYLYRDLAVQILLGSQWNEIADFMGLWALMSALTITFSNTACEVYRSMGKPNVSFVLQMIYLVIYIPVIYFSAQKGFSVLCYAGCFIRLLPICFDFIALGVIFNISPITIIKNTYGPFIAVIGMTVVALLCQTVADGVVWQFFSIATCALVYGLILFLLPGTRKEKLVCLKK